MCVNDALVVGHPAWADCVAHLLSWQPRPGSGMSKGKTPTSFLCSFGKGSHEHNEEIILKRIK